VLRQKTAKTRQKSDASRDILFAADAGLLGRLAVRRGNAAAVLTSTRCCRVAGATGPLL